jgi:hypothetical protein
MVSAPAVKTASSDVAIFGRLLSEHPGQMSVDLARYVLGLGFSACDQQRMKELAGGNQQGTLTADEHEELMGYVKAGHLVALLHSKARQALKKRKVS